MNKHEQTIAMLERLGPTSWEAPVRIFEEDAAVAINIMGQIACKVDDKSAFANTDGWGNRVFLPMAQGNLLNEHIAPMMIGPVLEFEERMRTSDKPWRHLAPRANMSRLGACRLFLEDTKMLNAEILKDEHRKQSFHHGTSHDEITQTKVGIKFDVTKADKTFLVAVRPATDKFKIWQDWDGNTFHAQPTFSWK